MRQEICESHERLPPCGGVGQPTIESSVDYEILAQGTGNCPEITDGVAILEWL